MLGHIQTFNPKIFDGDATCSTDLCNLVLALAVIHNDINGIELAFALRNTQGPFEEKKISAERGLAGGIGLQLAKLRLAVIHELLILLQKSGSALKDSYLDRMLAQMHETNRSAWRTIVKAAMEQDDATTLSRALCACRDKVSFHYDRKSIASAFRERFANNAEPPCISVGDSIASTRFYFGDAAVEYHLQNRGTSPARVHDIVFGADPILATIDHALSSMVIVFIKRRSKELGFEISLVAEMSKS